MDQRNVTCMWTITIRTKGYDTPICATLGDLPLEDDLCLFWSSMLQPMTVSPPTKPEKMKSSGTSYRLLVKWSRWMPSSITAPLTGCLWNGPDGCLRVSQRLLQAACGMVQMDAFIYHRKPAF
ncbi:hypothetical protein LEMLEM_LOCUS6546 [Lemmus lemmus]